MNKTPSPTAIASVIVPELMEEDDSRPSRGWLEAHRQQGKVVKYKF